LRAFKHARKFMIASLQPLVSSNFNAVMWQKYFSTTLPWSIIFR
jgi:hypothetical protein